MTALKWHQVHSWRLSQHGLSPRFSSQDFVGAVTCTGGIQAQVMSAAELAVCTRVEGFSPYDVQSAIFQDRTLVKTWAMRGTLHLLSARELPLYIAARDWQQNASWSNYFAGFGLSRAQQDAFLFAIPHVLEQGPLTRLQLADAVVKHTGDASMRDLILSSSWGTPLKPSAYRGDLCFGPGQGKTVTFMNPRVWIGKWQPIEPKLALQEIARRYLQAYGPVTADDFAFWWGCGKILAKKLFQSIEEELEEVEVEGWRAFALRATAPPDPFTLNELDATSVSPERPYSKDELHGYLVHLRQKCQTTIAELSDEKAHQQFTFPWPGEMPISFLELQLYNMRHVQEHAAQLNLFLGQHGIPDEALDWVSRAKDEPGSTAPARFGEDERRA